MRIEYRKFNKRKERAGPNIAFRYQFAEKLMISDVEKEILVGGLSSGLFRLGFLGGLVGGGGGGLTLLLFGIGGAISVGGVG